MKKPNLWKGVKATYSLRSSVLLLIIFISLISITPANSSENILTGEKEQTIPFLEKGMYLIIGVFQIRENAIQYAKSVKINGESPHVAKRKESNLYFVVAYDAKENLEFAREKRTELRSIDQFYDAWILYEGINLDDLTVVEDTTELIVVVPPQEVEQEEIPLPEPVVEESIPPPAAASDSLDIYKIRFQVVSGKTQEEVVGNISLVDASRNRILKSVSANEVHEVIVPTGKSLELIAICEIFGFTKEQKRFKVDDPASSSDNIDISESDGIINVKYELSRHEVGGILTMHNVYFYNNAAIMKPESKIELDNLLAMLNENDNMEIIIHGHTNGNNSGKLINLKKGDSNYFAVTENNDVRIASAKELSKARADIIARWLMENGIDRSKMQIKAWGGKKMIYKKKDFLASRNARVEIEIFKN